MKKKWVSFVWAPAMLLSMTAFSAQAGQELGKSCAEFANGTFSGLLSKPLICANGTWHDPQTLPNASISIAQVTPEKKVLDERYSMTLMGIPVRTQSRQNQCTFEQVATVVDFKEDNTAKVVVSFNDNCQGWKTQVDQIVPVGKATKIATDNNGNEYHVVVSRKDN